MMEYAYLWPFVLASLIVNITPGPDVLFVVARSVQAGTKAGLAGVMGITLGAFLHTLFAAFGLSLILASSETAFVIAKTIGAFYLLYLGIKTLRQSRQQPAIRSSRFGGTRSFFDGFLCNITNPKVALFMLAFLPQFADPTKGSFVGQIMLLGSVFIIGSIFVNGALAISAAKAATLTNGRIQVWLDRICGILFIGLAIKLLLTRR